MGRGTDADAGGRIEREPHNEPEPEIKSLDKVRCPECGTEEGIEEIDHPQLPPEKGGRCTERGHSGEPIQFHSEWKWERMTEEERKEAREAADRYAAEMAEHQHSATYHAAQREP